PGEGGQVDRVLSEAVAAWLAPVPTRVGRGDEACAALAEAAREVDGLGRALGGLRGVDRDAEAHLVSSIPQREALLGDARGVVALHDDVGAAGGRMGG